MKNRKIYAIFGIAIILALLIIAIPTTPALAAETLTLNPTQAKIGDRVNFTGSGWTTITTEVDYYVDLYLSDQQVSLSGSIDGTVTRYKKVGDAIPLETDGTFGSYFMLPTTLNQGTLGTATPLNLAVGTTYYVYATNRYNDPSLPGKTIKAIATLSVTPGSTLELSPTSGSSGSSITITGSNFPAGATIIIKFDNNAVAVAGGDTVIKSTGILISTVAVPSGLSTGAHTITVTAGTSTATATFTVVASAALDPLVPASGPAGTDVNISGANFPASTALVFKFDTLTLTPKAGTDASTRSSGVFISTVTVPSNAAAGAHTITVTAGTGSATATFTVTAPPTTTTTTTPPVSTTTTTAPPATTTTTQAPKPGVTTLTINKSGNNVGAAVGIGGAGFKKNGTVTLKYDDKEVGTAPVDASGFFVATFQIPPSKFGSHTVTATDGTNTNTITFEVESVAPKTPQPLSPAMGAKMKSPYKFDWGDVTDNSSPVTYKFQIATTTNFAADTILIDKSGLVTSDYTLSAAEVSKLDTGKGTLYWREKAVDAAQNESDWSGGGEFSISQPFKLTGLPLIGIIIVGAILMWLFGFWIGRKTAFYY